MVEIRQEMKERTKEGPIYSTSFSQQGNGPDRRVRRGAMAFQGVKVSTCQHVCDVGREVLGVPRVLDEDTRIAQDSSDVRDERARLGCEGKRIGRKATRANEGWVGGRRARRARA